MKCTNVTLTALLVMAGSTMGQPAVEELSERGAELLCRSEYKAAEATLRSALELAEKDERHAPFRGAIRNNLGVAMYHQGRYAEAEPVLRAALTELAPIASATDFANALNNLSAVYRRSGRVQESGLLAEDALRIFEEVQGPNSSGAGQAWLSLAELYRTMGRPDRAEKAARQAATILGGEGRAGTALHADALSTQAFAALALGRLDEAARLAATALEIRQAVLPGDDPRIAATLGLLGNVRLSARSFAEAAEHFERAIELWTRRGGEQHPNVAAWYNNLGQVYKLSGRFDDARAMYRKALAIWKSTLGPEHAEYGMGLANLADLLRAEGKLRSSARLYREAVAILRARLPGAEALANAERGLHEVERSAAAEHAAHTVDYRDLGKR